MHKYDDIDFFALDFHQNDEFDFTLLSMASLEEQGFGLRIYSHKSASTFKDYSGDFEAENMSMWIMRHTLEGYLLSTVAEISNETVMRLFDYGLPVLLYFRDVTS